MNMIRTIKDPSWIHKADGTMRIQRRAIACLLLCSFLLYLPNALVIPLSRREAVVAAATTSANGGAMGNSLLLGVSAPATTTAPPVSSVLLEDKYEFPLVSFGLQIYDDATAYKLTLTALEVGYRNFFASVLARNQKGFARAVRDSGIPRSDLFICGSVVSNRVRGYEAARIATTQGWQANMNAFAAAGNTIEYLDQIMLDYPGPDVDSIRGQWKAFEQMRREEQLVRTLSVSNFDGPQLDAILLDPQAQYRPVVNQLPYSVAYHPSLQANQQRNVLVQAWAPLGGSLGGRFNARIRQACADIGAAKGKSAYQVALRWVLQQGVAVCTQTTKREHFVEDLNLFDFTLSADEMKTLEALA